MPETSLAQLLDERLAARDVVVADDRIAPVDPEVMRRVWTAFCDFAAMPTDGLRPGLRVPRAGNSDLDGLTCERATERKRDDAAHLLGHPPHLSLTRRLYLVDENDEHADTEATALEIYLARAPFDESGWLTGAGGPPVDGVDGVDGVATWKADVEKQEWWPSLFSDHAILRIRRW